MYFRVIRALRGSDIPTLLTVYFRVIRALRGSDNNLIRVYPCRPTIRGSDKPPINFDNPILI